jgi:hypothetical protein
MSQAQSDVTDALTEAGADPSQIPSWFSDAGYILTVAMIAAIVYLAVQLLLLGKEWKAVLSP